MQWTQYRKAFELDGSLRDIYVLNTNSSDWNKLLKSLHHSYDIRFWVDDERVPSVMTIHELLKLRRKVSPLMLVNTAGVNIACHFFSDEQIEFDIDPREVINQRNLDGILAFMTFVGNLLQKKVLLTPENTENIPLISFSPTHQTMTYHKENEY